MSKEGVVIGVDVGSTGTKALVYSMAGTPVPHPLSPGPLLAYRKYPTTYPFPAHVEQSPLDWWNAFISCMNELLDALTLVGPFQVKAIALSGQMQGTSS